VGTVGGSVALGKQADDRYPRLSYVFAGILATIYKPTEKDIPPGSKIIEIPIWEDKTRRILSKEIKEGINRTGWAYGHGPEILESYLPSLLSSLDPDGKLTAEQIMRRRQLSL
jgi:hypothetical protein